MRVPSRAASRPGHIVCPACASGELRPRELHLDIAGCASCGLSVEGAVIRTLEQITTSPESIGAHPCECGHPQMRRLPERVFHCPACGSEVLPPKRVETRQVVRQEALEAKRFLLQVVKTVRRRLSLILRHPSRRSAQRE